MGILSRLFGKSEKKINIAMCGLDNAGKTSLLNFLKKGEFYESIATMGVNHENHKLGKLNMSIMDLGGQQAFRRFWPSYIERADILIFVVDSSDFQRLPQARDIFLSAVRNCSTPNIPILILATKQDLPNICSLAYIIQLFNLTNLYDRNIHVQKTSSKTGLGVYESFHWIHDQIIKPRTKKITPKIHNSNVPKPYSS
jgi:small GTP-binding protein